MASQTSRFAEAEALLADGWCLCSREGLVDAVMQELREARAKLAPVQTRQEKPVLMLIGACQQSTNGRHLVGSFKGVCGYCGEKMW